MSEINFHETYLLRRIETLIANKDTDFIGLVIMAHKKKYFDPMMYESFYLEGLSFACSNYNHSWHMLYEHIGLDAKKASELLEDFLRLQYLPHHDSTSLNKSFPYYVEDSLKEGKLFFSAPFMHELELRIMSNAGLREQMEILKYHSTQNYNVWMENNMPQNEDQPGRSSQLKI